MDLSISGEFGLIAEIRKLLGARLTAFQGISVGPGDDCAVVEPRAGFELLLKVDEAVEGVHFDRRWLQPREVGRRAMAQSLSDIAAMAGRPRWALVALALPLQSCLEDAVALVEGATERAAGYGCAVVGGNVARAASTAASITVAVVGEVEPGRSLLRSGARPGDAIYVTGEPGLARAGLLALQTGRENDPRLWEAVRRFRDPLPRMEEARFLRDRAEARAAIDLSDGLSGDLGHLCAESGVGARLNLCALSMGEALRGAAAALGLEPEELALEGGEDFELLVAAPEHGIQGARAEFERRFSIPLVKVGEVTAAREILLEAPGKPARLLRMRSYEHFRTRE